MAQTFRLYKVLCLYIDGEAHRISNTLSVTPETGDHSNALSVTFDLHQEHRYLTWRTLLVVETRPAGK